MKRLLALLFLFSSWGQLFAQDFSFVVIFKKGKVVSTSEKESTNLSIGSTVDESKTIELVKGGYVALMNTSGIATELFGPGEYAIKEVVKNVPKGPVSRLEDFGKFVVEQMSWYDELVMRDYKKRNNSVAGASRGIGDQKYVRLLLDEGGQNWIYGDRVMLKWISDDSLDSRFTLSVKDVYSKTLLEETIEQDWYTLQLGVEQFRDKEYVIVSVRSSNEEVASKDYFISKMTDDEKRIRIKNDLEFFTEEIAAHYLLKALYFERKDLDVDALTAYERAVELSSDMDIYKTLRDKFVFTKILEVSK